MSFIAIDHCIVISRSGSQDFVQPDCRLQG
jgi:hypothetical protein